MFWKMVFMSLQRKMRRKLLAFFSLMFGVALCVAVISLVIVVEDHLQRELRALGANFVVETEESSLPVEIAGVDLSELKDEHFLPEKKITKIAHIFWKNNILGFVPVLPVRVQVEGASLPVVLNGTWLSARKKSPKYKTSIFSLNPNWKIHIFKYDGVFPDAVTVVGMNLAKKLKLKGVDRLKISLSSKAETLVIIGTVRTGGKEDDEMFASLPFVQRLSGNEGKVKKIFVSALTTPEHKVYERLGTNRMDLSPKEFEKWYCTPFPSSIAYQLHEAFPESNVRIVRKFAETEGILLSRLKGLFFLVTAVAVAVSALSVGNAIVTAIRERKQEIGLLKTLGAKSAHVMALFVAEGMIVGILGGLCGSALGIFLSRMSQKILFHSVSEVSIVFLPLSVIFSMLIAFVGSFWSVMQMAKLKPVECLKYM